MLKETLLRALSAVRVKITTADANAAGWLIERDRRRRQEATFLRGLVRIEGSQRKAALVTGISQQTISRMLDPEGHAKLRAEDTRRRRDPSFQKLGSNTPQPEEEDAPIPASNVVKMRRRRPDWQPREPRRAEIRKWFEQYLGWTQTAQATARMLVFNAEKGKLPDAAYYDDDEPSDRKGAVGPQKRVATGAD